MSFKDCKTSGEMLTHFIQHHYIQWRGDPVQATTYCKLKIDTHRQLCEILDAAIAEIGTNNERSYKSVDVPKEWSWR